MNKLSQIKKEISAGIKGSIGEHAVSAELRKLPRDLCYIYNNVMLETEKGTTQIDHIVVAPQGVFVLETKNYQGSIYGSEKAQKWKQYLGGKEYSFYNPLRQNYGHIKALSKAIGIPEKLFVSVLVFPDETKLMIETNEAAAVGISGISYYIKGYLGYGLTRSQADRAREVLSTQNIISFVERREHVQRIKENIQKAEESVMQGICPQCGGKLVLRKGEYGSFYGCSNYPKCRFKKKI